MELEQGFNSMTPPLGHQYNKSMDSVSGDSVSGMMDISDDSTGLSIVPDGYEWVNASVTTMQHNQILCLMFN